MQRPEDSRVCSIPVLVSRSLGVLGGGKLIGGFGIMEEVQKKK